MFYSITYNSARPTKWEIIIYVLAVSNTGFVCANLSYYGSINSENFMPVSIEN